LQSSKFPQGWTFQALFGLEVGQYHCTGESSRCPLCFYGMAEAMPLRNNEYFADFKVSLRVALFCGEYIAFRELLWLRMLKS
jgi:hypothetical protein